MANQLGLGDYGSDDEEEEQAQERLGARTNARPHAVRVNFHPVCMPIQSTLHTSACTL